MSKKTHAPQVPKELTRKHVARAERDARATRYLMLGTGGAVALAVLLILFGVLRLSVLLPNEPVARVGDQTISTREFQQRVRLERMSLIQQLDFYQSVGLSDNVTQISQQLNDQQGLGSQVINTLVNEAIFRTVAPSLDVIVSADDVQKTLEEGFNYFRVTPTPAPTLPPAPTPTASATVTVTPQPTLTPAPTPTPVTAEGFQQLYSKQLNTMSQLGFGEADYRHFVESQLIADRVQKVVTRQVLTMTEQVQFRYIVASQPQDMAVVKSAVDTQGFDKVYGQVLSQTFVITSASASETPLVTRDDISNTSQFGPDFANAAFTAPISGTFGVITNTGGSIYYMGKVLDRGVRELSSSAYQRAQNAALQKWLADQRAALKVEVLTWEDRVPADPSPNTGVATP